MSSSDAEQVTTGSHHIFVVPTDEDIDGWLRSHLAEMERQGFRVVGTSTIQDPDNPGKEQLVFTMVKPG